MKIGIVTRLSLSTYAAASLVCGCQSQSDDIEEDGHQLQEEIVYGNDNRLEYGAITDQSFLLAADATAAIFDSTMVSCSGGECDLSTSQFQNGRTGSLSWEPLCAGERFIGQQQGAGCTAFLIGPKTFATAGHCMACLDTVGACDANFCETTRVVFGFTADTNGDNEVTTVPEANVYSCVGNAQGIDDNVDFAIFDVDRIVTQRTPMIIDREEKVPVGENLFVTGHPDGLPLKLASGVEVKEDRGSDTFGHSADAFGGNSGSPLINLTTKVAEGIHSRSPWWHYLAVQVGSETCAQTNVCSATTGCSTNFGESAWPIATRFSWISTQVSIPLHPALIAAISPG
jgi:V8-like Glu-specific endopeptidase